MLFLLILCHFLMKIDWPMNLQKLTNTKIKLENFNFMFCGVQNHFCCLICFSCLILLSLHPGWCWCVDGVGGVDRANDVNCDQTNCNDRQCHHQIVKLYVFVLHLVSILVQGLCYQFIVISILVLYFVSTTG